LLADAETFYNLHSLCLDENDRVRSSKAPVRVHAWWLTIESKAKRLKI